MTKIKTTGAAMKVDGLPARAVLEHDETPGEILAAVEELEGLAAEYGDAYRAREEVEKETRAASTHTVRASREAEVQAASVNERGAEKAAASAAKVAGSRVVALMEEHAETLDRITARITLAAHALEIEALVQAHRARALKVSNPGRAEWVPEHDRHDTNAATVGALSELQRTDRVNSERLVSLAGEDFAREEAGLVPVRGARPGIASGGPVMWTTPARAALLTRAPKVHGWAWSLVDDVEVEGVPA